MRREVELSILQRGRRLLWCRMMDDLPAAFLEAPQWLQLTCYPDIPATLRYAFTSACTRGIIQRESSICAIAAAIGLLERWSAADLTQTVRIYPATGTTQDQSLFLVRSPANGTATTQTAATRPGEGV